MKKELECKFDIVDVTEDIKSQVAFLGFAITTMVCSGYCPNHESDPGQEIIHGMSVTFEDLRDKIDNLSDKLQENLHDITEDDIRMLNKVSGVKSTLVLDPMKKLKKDHRKKAEG